MVMLFTHILQGQQTITLTPDADAWLRVCEKPGYTYITSTNYQTIIRNHSSEWSWSGYRLADRAIMNFDLSSLPAGAVITSARLSLYSQTPQTNDDLKHRSTAMGGYQSNACYIERVTESWGESTVTWANQPPTTTANRITLAASTTPDQDYLDLDVTGMVQDMIDNPGQSFGFMMRLVNEQKYARMAFCSREHTETARHPKLEVTYSLPSSVTIKTQPQSQDLCIGERMTVETQVNDGINWQDPNIWTMVGDITWDEARQAWKCVGYCHMTLKQEYAVYIDASDSYDLSVDIENESSSGRFYWGGFRYDENFRYLNYLYYTANGNYPPTGTSTYIKEGLTGNASSYAGWGFDKGYYALYGHINHQESETAVSYISNIQIRNSTRDIDFFGTSTVNYQWYKDGAALTGENNSRYIQTSMSTAEAGAYYCQVYEGGNTLQTTTATIAAKATPEIIQGVPTGVFCEGSEVNLEVNGNMNAPAEQSTYRWYKDGVLVQEGPNNFNLTLPSMAAADEGLYTCYLDNGFCEVMTDGYVSLPPEIESEDLPAEIVVHEDSSLTLSMEHREIEAINWRDPDIWLFTGNITWDPSRQAWRCEGYGTMYLKPDYAIGIDPNHSYSLQVDVYDESSNSRFYWGGKRYDENMTFIKGYGGSYDYSCTNGGSYPENGYTRYQQIGKTGTAESYTGWGTQCRNYAVGGLINHGSTNSSEVMYISNIRFYDATENKDYLTDATYSYAWYKDGTEIPGATNSTLTINPVAASDAGNYHGVISHPCASANTTNTFVRTVESGLIGQWNFSGDAADSGPYALSGVVHGATPTFDRHFQSKQAYAFDGVDDYIQLGSPGIFDFKKDQDFSLTAWIKSEETQSDHAGILTNGAMADYNPGWALRYINGKIYFSIGDGSSRVYISCTDCETQTGEWYNITITVDRDNIATIYYNGEYLNSIDVSDYNVELNSGYETFIGQCGSYRFNGSIDEVKLYTKALTPLEVTALYQSEQPAEGVAIPYSAQATVSPLHNVTPSSDQNYVHTISPRDSMQAIPASPTPFEATESIQYFDGLGRPLQTVSVAASPTGADIIQPFEYNEFGREVKKYLPYTATGNDGHFDSQALGSIDDVYTAGKQYEFYTQTGVDYATTTTPFAETVFEPSPLNRVYEQGAPGADWQVDRDPTTGESTENGHTVKNYFGTNVAHSVKIWVADATLFGISQNGTYPAGELYVTEVLGENYDGVNDRHISREYINKQGQVILKESQNNDGTWLQTYYVYDDFGLLRCVIPPLAAAKNPAEIIDQELCYFYLFDYRKRMIEKKLPGTDVVYMVYNNRNLLIATQDGNQRNNYSYPRWTFIKYDVLNRPIMTGEITDFFQDEQRVNINSRQAMKNYLYEFYTTRSNYYESRNSFTIHKYTDLSFPANDLYDYCYTEYDIHTVTYYDTYDDFPSGFNAAGYSTNGVSGFNNIAQNDFLASATSNTVGLVTGSKVRNLTTGDFYFTTTYYDDKARVIQTYSENQFIGGTDRRSFVYNFVGEVLKVVHEHYNGINTILMGERFVYDHTGRVLEHYNQLAGASEILLAANTYNELGVLIAKYNHGTDDGAGGIITLQKTDYEYNIRGWLTKINDTDNLGNDLFAMNLLYNNTDGLDAALSVDVQYNGNIAATTWLNAGAPATLKAYSYTYDGINRIKTANYGTSADWTVNNYDVGGPDAGAIEYDANGNIMGLYRYGSDGSYIDQLSYIYLNGGNRLAQVDDNSLNTIGFSDGTNPGNDFTYDANGNMVTDQNKDITNDIVYNYLNLPQSITRNGNTTNYTYNAAGQKLAYLNGQDGKLTEYVGSFVYENGNLAYVLTPEGRIMVNGNTYGYEYNLKDHLGNTRVVMNQLGDLVQAADYYPFGMRQEPINQLGSDNKYLYNGKEMQDDTEWYDYGWRMYSPDLARWHNIDAMAEEYLSQSPYHFSGNNPIPYHFSGNNPIKFVDFNGMDYWIYNSSTGEFYRHSDLGGNEYQFLTVVDGDNKVIGNANVAGENAYLTLGEEGVMWSNYDPWEGVSENYNEGTGYEYDLSDLAMRNDLVNGDGYKGFGRAIQKREAAGRAEPITAENYWDTYGHTLGSLRAAAPYIKAGAGLSAGAQGGGGQAQPKRFNYVRQISHGTSRALQRGVTPKQVNDALKNPLKVKPTKYDSFGRPSQTYIGKNATVVVNPTTGKVITMWRTGSKTLKALSQ
jgi:RHS repeat-associated protein